MNSIEQDKLLAHQIDLKVELYEFCVEALKSQFPGHDSLCEWMFKNNYESYDHIGCIQSFDSMKQQIQVEIEARQKRIEEGRRRVAESTGN